MRKDESSYRAARQYQADHPGVSYTRAKRIVTASMTATRAALAATYHGADGRPVVVNLEWPSDFRGSSSSGPHAVLIGADSAALLPSLLHKLSAAQDECDLEIVYSTAESPVYSIGAKHTHLTHQQIVDHVDGLACTRQDMLRQNNVPDIEKARAAGQRIPTVAVFIDRPDLTLVEAIIGWSRIGRALGINFVVAGVRLETQSTNVPACRLYQRHGFVLGGADRLVYRADPALAHEVALYWYWFDTRD